MLGHPYHILAKLPCTNAFNVARNEPAHNKVTWTDLHQHMSTLTSFWQQSVATWSRIRGWPRNWSKLCREFRLVLNRSRTRQNFELVHIIGPVQNFGPPARNFGPLRAEFAWREWRKTLGGHVANWAGLSGFSPQENTIFHTFFIDCNNKYSKVSNAHNSDDCHGVFNGGMLNKGWSFSRSRFDCLGLMHFFHE